MKLWPFSKKASAPIDANDDLPDGVSLASEGDADMHMPLPSYAPSTPHSPEPAVAQAPEAMPAEMMAPPFTEAPPKPGLNAWAAPAAKAAQPVPQQAPAAPQPASTDSFSLDSLFPPAAPQAEQLMPPPGASTEMAVEPAPVADTAPAAPAWEDLAPPMTQAMPEAPPLHQEVEAANAMASLTAPEDSFSGPVAFSAEMLLPPGPGSEAPQATDLMSTAPTTPDWMVTEAPTLNQHATDDFLAPPGALPAVGFDEVQAHDTDLMPPAPNHGLDRTFGPNSVSSEPSLMDHNDFFSTNEGGADTFMVSEKPIETGPVYDILSAFEDAASFREIPAQNAASQHHLQSSDFPSPDAIAPLPPQAEEETPFYGLGSEPAPTAADDNFYAIDPTAEDTFHTYDLASSAPETWSEAAPAPEVPTVQPEPVWDLNPPAFDAVPAEPVQAADWDVPAAAFEAPPSFEASEPETAFHDWQEEDNTAWEDAPTYDFDTSEPAVFELSPAAPEMPVAFEHAPEVRLELLPDEEEDVPVYDLSSPEPVMELTPPPVAHPEPVAFVEDAVPPVVEPSSMSMEALAFGEAMVVNDHSWHETRSQAEEPTRPAPQPAARPATSKMRSFAPDVFDLPRKEPYFPAKASRLQPLKDRSIADDLHSFEQEMLLKESRFMKKSIDDLVNRYFAQSEEDDNSWQVG